MAAISGDDEEVPAPNARMRQYGALSRLPARPHQIIAQMCVRGFAPAACRPHAAGTMTYTL
jgi:hypothetical protein